MRKVFYSAILLLAGVFFMSACGGNNDDERQEVTFENVRLAFIHPGNIYDRGYTYRQHDGTLAMAAALGIDPETQIRNFWTRLSPDEVTTSIEEAIAWGADMIFATSFGHGPPMLEAARNNPDIMFHHATGNLAVDANLPNFHNYFGNMSQARYMSGIAAGLRTETNVLGFVAAHPNSEVITGLTAFFLGAQSVNPDVRMYVQFMGVWNNPTLESQIAQALIDQGADVLGQHADSPATQLVAQENGVWSVGYNNCVIAEAPDATLVAPMFVWEIYLNEAVRNFVEGRGNPTDFIRGWNEGMVVLSDFNTNTIAPGTVEAVVTAEAQIRAGRNVFTGPIYGYRNIGPQAWSDTPEQLLAPGEEWIEPMSAPSWAHRVSGIIFLN
ncbi:MAG: BMP family ABC transporter substrate-binding protein [Defluviitaleaceae bacterium]|nr:BMP family ABC transporter substrate-binding protein [Defluviitaleaceae bacterium]